MCEGVLCARSSSSTAQNVWSTPPYNEKKLNKAFRVRVFSGYYTYVWLTKLTISRNARMSYSYSQ